MRTEANRCEMHIRWVSRVFSFLLLACVLSVSGLVSVPASAHALLLGSTPSDGVILEVAPESITLTFNEPVQIVAEAMQLIYPDGTQVALTAQSNGVEVVMDLPPDVPEGTLTIAWRVVSADSHPVAGTLAFSIGIVTGSAEIASASTTGSTAALGFTTAIAYLALFYVVGLAWFRNLILHSESAKPSSFAGGAALIAVLAQFLLVLLSSIRDRGTGLSSLTALNTWKMSASTAEVQAFLMVSVGLVVLWAGTRITSSRRRNLVLIAGGVIALAALILVGHSRVYGPTKLMHSADLIHAIAGAFWFGGLIGLVSYLRKSENKPTSDNAAVTAAETVVRFSTWAAITVAAIGASGVTMAVLILDSWSALIHTTYGRLLIIKVAMISIPLLLAAWNRWKLIPMIRQMESGQHGWNSLRRTVASEAGVLVLVLGITGVLVLQNPNLPVAATPGMTSAPATATILDVAMIGSDMVHLAIEPADLGANTVTIGMMKYDGSPMELVEPPRVDIILPDANIGPISYTLQETETIGTYIGELDFPVAGDWTVQVSTRVSKFEEPVSTFRITIPNAVPTPVASGE